MTSELKTCPFCGSDNVFVQCMVYMLEGYKRHYVECYDCGADVGVIKNPNGTFGAFYETKQQAIEAWNTRAERTCRNVSDPPEGFLCSECGWGDFAEPSHLLTGACYAGLAKGPRYCPNCGARVVER